MTTTLARRITRETNRHHTPGEIGTQLGFDVDGAVVHVVPRDMWLADPQDDRATYWLTVGRQRAREANAQAIIDLTDQARRAGLRGGAVQRYVSEALLDRARQQAAA